MARMRPQLRLLHVGQDLPDEAHGGEVDLLEGRRPLLVGHLLEGPGRRPAHVGHQHVHAAECPVGLRHDPRDVRRPGSRRRSRASTSAPVCLLRPRRPRRCSSASPRAHITTRAPSAARPRRDALPMPLLAATTSAILPLRPRSIGTPLSACVSGYLLVEVRAVAAGHVEPRELVVAHHLEGRSSRPARAARARGRAPCASAPPGRRARR